MAKYSRVTAKVFGETASTSNTPKEIGQFGSAKAGTYNATGDIATIQSLPAWSNGWIDSVTPTQQFPSLPEMTGVHKVLSQQIAYILQQGIAEWDSATTYYTNCFCSKAGKIYVSQSDNNTNNDPESDTVNWNEFASGGASRNIGEIVISTTPLTDAGLHLLDGALLNYGSYQDVIDYYADLYNSGDYSAIFTTEATWQSTVTTYGVCGKFVYDSVNKTLRIPKITGFIEGTNTQSELGDVVEAGLPQHTHDITRPLRGGASGGNVPIGWSCDTGGGGADTTFTTSNASNSIYGNSNTVQPQSIKIYYYIVIATTTKTQIQVNIDEIATDLNGKADTDGSNINQGFSTSLASNMSNTANIYMSGLNIPSSTIYDDLTLGASGSTYTAPANGWFFINKKSNSQPQYITISASAYGVQDWANGSNQNLKLLLLVKKGETVSINYSLGGSTDAFRFIYAKGSESEA